MAKASKAKKVSSATAAAPGKSGDHIVLKKFVNGERKPGTHEIPHPFRKTHKGAPLKQKCELGAWYPGEVYTGEDDRTRLEHEGLICKRKDYGASVEPTVNDLRTGEGLAIERDPNAEDEAEGNDSDPGDADDGDPEDDGDATDGPEADGEETDPADAEADAEESEQSKASKARKSNKGKSKKAK